MAKTLLDGVNEVLKRVRVIDGDTSVLSGLTSSAIQSYIDLSIQVLNEAVEDLYSEIDKPMPKGMGTSTITLVNGDRDYALASDLVQIHFPLHDLTNGQYIAEYVNGYRGLITDQAIPGDWTGVPDLAAIRPSDNELYMDRIPQAEDVTSPTRIYSYNYDKDVSLSVATDTFPFSDAVFRALIPAAAQLWRRDRENSFDGAVFKSSMGRASRFMTGVQQRESYGPHRVEGRRRKVDFLNPYG